MLTDWIQAVSTVVLVVVMIIYTFYTKSLAQIGKEPVLDIKRHSILNVRCYIEIENLSEFFAKNILIKLIRIDQMEINFDGLKVLYPKKTGLYKAIEKPLFKSFERGDKLIIECKSILGKKTIFKYIYEEKRIDIDKEIPAKFNLIDVSQ